MIDVVFMSQNFWVAILLCVWRAVYDQLVFLQGRPLSGHRVSENSVRANLTLFHLVSAAQRFVHSLNTFEEALTWRVAKTSRRSPKDFLLPQKELQAIVKKDGSWAQVQAGTGLLGGTIENST